MDLSRAELMAVIETLQAEIKAPINDKLSYKELDIIKRFNDNLENALEKFEEELKRLEGDL